MGLVLYRQDMNRYQYEGHMGDTENKQMKHGYSKLLYNQRNKDETIFSVIKRLFGEHITSSRLVGKNAEQRAIS
jgi:hypothetical protein